MQDPNLVEMRPCPEDACYFSFFHKMDWETKPRPAKSIVSSQCSNDLKRLSEITHPVDPNTGETNALALLICRGTGECDLDFSDPKVIAKWSNVRICQHHIDELLNKWGSSFGFRNAHIYRNAEKNVCSLPEGIAEKHRGTARPPSTDIMTIKESDAVNKQFGYLVHPGIPLCKTHKQFLAQLLTKKDQVAYKRTHYEDGFYSNSDENSCPRDLSFIEPSAKKPRTQAGYALKKFAEFVEVERVCFPTKNFGDLGKRTQQNKVCSSRKLFDAMMDAVAGGNGEELKKQVLAKLADDESWTSGSSENFKKIMKQTAAQYYAAEDRKSRITILSIVANSVPYLTVENHYMYKAAKKFARRNKFEAIVNLDDPKITRQRYDRDTVHFFIDFITSPAIMIGLPYGTRKVKLSDGSKYELPDTIRQQSSSEIYEMYSKLMKSSYPTTTALSKTTVFRILKICSATDRRATTCVDYYTADGMQAFDGLHDILDVWMNEDLAHLGTLKQLKTELFEAAQYLRTDFRLHIKKCSRVADHCATFALSDPSDREMSSSCSTSTYKHNYNLKCDRCERVSSTLQSIEIYSEAYVADALKKTKDQSMKQVWEKRSEELGLIKKYKGAIFEMKKHYLRAAYTSQEREDIINNLQDNEVLLTIDFAQKYLPRWHREKQNDYFGKKGITYHVSHSTARVGDVYTQHSFVHIYDSEVVQVRDILYLILTKTVHTIFQDSRLVVITLSHVLSELKKVGIGKVHIRSDNAGSYHCATTINSMHWLMKESGVKIGSYTFSESQNGKSSSDRDANRVKRKAESYVAKGGDITTPEQFFEALKQGKPLNGMSIHYGSANYDEPGSSKWEGISNLNHFTVEENGIRGRRYGGIGQGHFLSIDKLNSMNGTHNFYKEAGFAASGIGSIESEKEKVKSGLQTNFWYHAECKAEKKENPDNDFSTCIQESSADEQDDEIMRSTHDVGKLYSCPEHGCAASFVSHWNLEKHIIRGKHTSTPEKLTLRDEAVNLFGKNIEEVQKTRTYSVVADALDELKETTENSALTIGWALPKKQTRVRVRQTRRRKQKQRRNRRRWGKRHVLVVLFFRAKIFLKLHTKCVQFRRIKFIFLKIIP
ncbi:hypothetical protein CAEBREN_30714 [Caenorhabditis brenneri]|uniref:C2H2-type domain-containing protein n=1 Tax=Caenorhabditis brenneri TaxID=135651 RepID=G0PNH1_CAEBE|nr:hypothetical protein CAEBREN_30714 [Caenorhabditis brenneri]